MSARPLVLVVGLTLGDYLLWNWSLNSNHDVLALISGLSLPPLGVACVWLFALAVMRLLARARRSPADRSKLERYVEQPALRAPAPEEPAPPRKIAA